MAIIKLLEELRKISPYTAVQIESEMVEMTVEEFFKKLDNISPSTSEQLKNTYRDITKETEKWLEELKQMNEELHELEKELTEEERFSLIYGMDDAIYEL